METLQRTSSTIPFGYELDDDNKTLNPIPEQLETLKAVAGMVKNQVLSLREGSLWVTEKTGRNLSHVGLKNIIENGRLETEPRELPDR